MLQETRQAEVCLMREKSSTRLPLFLKHLYGDLPSRAARDDPLRLPSVTPLSPARHCGLAGQTERTCRQTSSHARENYYLQHFLWLSVTKAEIKRCWRNLQYTLSSVATGGKATSPQQKLRNPRLGTLELQSFSSLIASCQLASTAATHNGS